MKHLIWLLPLILALGLTAWCEHYPLAGSGREFLAVLLYGISFMLLMFVRFNDKHGVITGYNEVHTNDR